MALNIKNQEINDAARELAALTGESMSEAVTLAVKERLGRLQRESGESKAERLLRIGKDCAAHMKEHGGAMGPHMAGRPEILRLTEL